MFDKPMHNDRLKVSVKSNPATKNFVVCNCFTVILNITNKVRSVRNGIANATITRPSRRSGRTVKILSKTTLQVKRIVIRNQHIFIREVIKVTNAKPGCPTRKELKSFD